MKFNLIIINMVIQIKVIIFLTVEESVRIVTD